MNIQHGLIQLGELKGLPKGWNYGSDGPLSERAYLFSKLALMFLSSIDASRLDVLPACEGGATIIASLNDDTVEVVVGASGSFDVFFQESPEFDREQASYGEFVSTLEEAGWKSQKSLGSHTHVFSVESTGVLPAPPFGKVGLVPLSSKRHVFRKLVGHFASTWTDTTTESEASHQYSGGLQQAPLLMEAG